MEVSNEIPGKDRSWVILSLSIISLRLLMLVWWASINRDISKFGMSISLFGRIGMNQPFSNYFDSLVASIVAHFPMLTCGSISRVSGANP